jgi:hypothetical protein
VYCGINASEEGHAMATNQEEWPKELEAELASLASDMWATQKRLEEKGFRVDSGNKAAGR